MKASLLAIPLAAVFFCCRPVLGAEQYFSPTLQVAPATNGTPNELVEKRDYLLSYHAENWPQKYLEWLWKDPINLLTRPAYWRGEEWETFGIEAGITGALLPLDNTVRDFIHDDNRSASLDDGLNTVRTITGGGTYFFAASGAIFGSGLIV